MTSKGEYGKADVMAKATYVNGEETERTILSSVTLKEPVTEYRLRGTKVRAHLDAYRQLPLAHQRSDQLLLRRTEIPRRHRLHQHKGIDIAVPRGTPIYAADGGTVTYSRLDERLRLSGADRPRQWLRHPVRSQLSLTVSVGQHVYKGQQVARAGSTGNSTGNHCHFEVRYNGVAKNPLNYLRNKLHSRKGRTFVLLFLVFRELLCYDILVKLCAFSPGFKWINT